MSDVQRQPLAPRGKTASKQIHKTAQPSKTLMRHAVKKPSTITDHKTIAMDVVSHAPSQAATEVFHAVSPGREHRAEIIRQNSLVSRFGGELRQAQSDVKPAAARQLAGQTQPTAAPEAVQAAAPAPLASRSATNKMLDKGLRNANSHEETMAKKAKLHHRVGKKLGLSARAASVAAGSLVVLVVGGFFAYQNIPNLSVRYASTKAGVRASLPAYQPSGFTVNSHVAYAPGEISVAYKANADNRAYVITQKNTNWNSDALKEHLMGETGNIPQSYPDSGRTIYLHDNHEADWVNNGVWYSISGDSSLNTDQLIKIATSL